MIALALLVGCFPIAVIMTIFTSPFWAWFERQFGIEAYGHSGPASWCYLVMYGLLVAICTLQWSRINRRRQPKENE